MDNIIEIIVSSYEHKEEETKLLNDFAKFMIESYGLEEHILSCNRKDMLEILKDI